MTSKVALHKLNGHRRSPAPDGSSARELVALVHPAPASSSDVDAGTPRAMSGRERPAVSDRDAPALASALARTRAALARGELPQLRAALDALTSRADLAATIVEQLADTARASVRAPAVPRRALIDINEALLHALGRYCASAPGTVQVASRLDPQLPAVAGDEPELRDAFLDVMQAVTRNAEASGRCGAIRLGTSRHDGVLRGEPIVRIVITDGEELAAPAGPAAPPEQGESFGRAARIVSEHGGIVAARSSDAGRLHVTIELPAI